jgi:FlaA1/EpsC-like NDP-sugar epimerase
LFNLVRPRYWYLAIFDGVLSVLAVWLAVSLRNEEWFIVKTQSYPIFLLAAIGLPLCLALRQCYNSLDLTFSYENVRALIGAISLFAVLFVTGCITLYPTGVPRSVGLIQPMIVSLILIPPRIFLLLLDSGSRVPGGGQQSNVFIYGAGSAGRFLLSSLRHTNTKVRGFIDDDPKKVGGRFHDLRVFAADNLPFIDDSAGVDIILAMPSIDGQRRSVIYEKLTAKGYKVLTVPTLVQLGYSLSNINQIRQIEVEDLLDREVVQPDRLLMRSVVEGRSVLITGGGGSIGSELARQVLRLNPRRLIVFDHSEFALFQIHQQVTNAAQVLGVEIDPVLGSVTSSSDLESVFANHAVDIVFHAAAYKHVHLLEQNVHSGVYNNVVGTKRVVDACLKHSVSKMVLISTDKAVKPSSVMGISKRIAELVVEVARLDAERSGSEVSFSIVRFGNVLGSNGSVVPIFREQIANGGPVTVTSPEVTRYFMTIPEAAALVIQAAGLRSKACLFVLDMGKPVSILSLAETIIAMAGKKVTFSLPKSAGEVQVKFTGLKPGEKLHEDLFFREEDITTTSHPSILEAPPPVHKTNIRELLTNLISDIECAADSGCEHQWSDILSRAIAQVDG